MIAPTRRGVLAGTAALGGLAATGVTAPAVADPAPVSPRARLSLDQGWRFHEGDIAFPAILDHEAAYANAKAGNATGAAASDYDERVGICQNRINRTGSCKNTIFVISHKRSSSILDPRRQRKNRSWMSEN